MPEEQGGETCPPHRWFIEAEYSLHGSKEIWTCSRCNEVKTVMREKSEPARPSWTVGRATPRPAPEPETPSPAPPESAA
ncbi:MAG TPA: hypothetical protein VKU60_06515 [Chloroflexota bacterium]|nr:hypothetical protein [Chloroflexota bacterium]